MLHTGARYAGGRPKASRWLNIFSCRQRLPGWSMKSQKSDVPSAYGIGGGTAAFTLRCRSNAVTPLMYFSLVTDRTLYL